MKSFVLIFLLLSSVSSLVLSEEIDVLFNRELYPFEFLNDKGQPDGFTIDLIYALAREAAISINLIAGNWTKSDEALFTGNIDLVPRYLTDSSSEHIISSDPLYSVYFALIQNEKPTNQNYNSLRGQTLVLSSGDSSEEYLIKRSISEQSIKTRNWMDSLKALKSGYGDYAIVSTVHYKIYSEGFDDSMHKNEGFDLLIPFGFTAARWDRNMLNSINNGISIIKVSGEFDRIYRKWFGNDENLIISRSKPQDRISIYVMSAILLMVVFIFLLNKRKVKS